MDVEAFVDGTSLKPSPLEIVPRGVINISLHMMDARGLLHKIEGDGAIAGHLDIGDGLRHQLQAISISCEECRS